MSVRDTRSEKKVALFCSTSGWAFGPTFNSSAEARSFVRYCQKVSALDLRLLDDEHVAKLHADWRLDRAKKEVSK